MLGFIKNLFSGILSFFTGLVGGKKFQKDHPSIEGGKPKASTVKPRKSKGYFMELDETDEQKPGEVLQQAKAVASKTLEQAKAVVSKTSDQAKAVASKAPEQAKAIVSNSEPVAEPAKAASAKTQAKFATAQTAKAETATTPSPKVELVQTAEGLKAKPAKAASTVGSTNGQNQAETTFAPKYLAPSASSNGRRRPGPNMNPFLDMARQVKTPG